MSADSEIRLAAAERILVLDGASGRELQTLRLTEDVVRGGGFDWFGGPSPRLGLTAYGLLQLHEMAAVYPVDEALRKRTEAALLAQRESVWR